MIAIIDYNSGNIKSVSNALKRLGQDFIVTKNPDEILKANKVILPGVGRVGQAMKELSDLGLIEVIKKIKVPFLGICLGMQLLLDSSEEDPGPCLSIIPGIVKKLPTTVIVPNIGWNNIELKDSSLFKGIDENNSFYFVHSYYCDVSPEYVLAESEYGLSFPVIIKKDNFYGIQFHPEKSSKDGEKLLTNFLNL